MSWYTLKETFEEVYLRARKSGKCPCGKRLVRAMTFSQTLNPYNKKDGRLKTRTEIIQELQQERQSWLGESLHCSTPSYWSWSDEQRDSYNNKGSVVIEASCGTKITKTKPL